MEWNWFGKRNDDLTPNFVLSESSGDSEEVNSANDVRNNDHYYEENESVNDDNDDAQSCSYDNSPHPHDVQSQIIRIIDHDDGKRATRKKKKLKDSSKQQQSGSHHKSCVVDPLNQRESDRKFWEACLAS